MSLFEGGLSGTDSSVKPEANLHRISVQATTAPSTPRQQKPDADKGFRYDINALRALGVTAVLLFHYKVHQIPGGFAGVDVFFVISGYLMTSIIMGRLTKNRFNIRDFYYDRAKRIIPGLLGLCGFLLLVGYFVLEPTTYHELSEAATSSLLFFSNFTFWKSINYFDARNDTRWLLHTWSLSVEWQFYMLYPLILMALYARERVRRWIVPILVLASLASLAWCIWLSEGQHESAFYMLPPRSWELLAGGLVALRFKNPERKYSSLLLVAGFLLIGLSLFFFDEYMVWPGYAALAPVVGTCLIIAANRSDAAVFRNSAIQTVGRWSYSIYLWHLPILAAANYCGFTKTTPLKIAAQIVILGLIIFFGGLLTSFVEKAWGRLFAGRLQGLAAGAGVLAGVVGFSMIVTQSEGLPNRQPDTVRQIQVYQKAAKDWYFPSDCNGRGTDGKVRPCRLGAPNDSGVALLGDSFSMQFYGRFAEIAHRNPNDSFTFLTLAGCPAMSGILMVTDPWKCNGFFEKALKFVDASHFKRVVLTSAWYGYFVPGNQTVCFVDGASCVRTSDPDSYYKHLDAAFASLRDRLLRLRKRGIEVMIIGATPSSPWNLPIELAKRKFLGLGTQTVESDNRDGLEAEAAPVKSRLKALAAAVGGKFVDPYDYLCDSQRCPAVDASGVPYTVDGAHYRWGVVRSDRFAFLDAVAK